MEVENSLDDFNRTKCSRSRFQSTSSSSSSSSSEKKLSDSRRSRSRSRSRYRPEKKLSDTRYKDEKNSEKHSKKKSKKKSEKKLSVDTRYKEEKKSSSSDDDEEFYFPSGHKRCNHGITRKALKPFNKYFKQLRDSEGYEVPFCPSFCVYVRVFRCVVDEEQEFFNETCRKCIAEYNKKHTEEPDYEFLDVVMATKEPVCGFNYYITFRARQVHLPDVVKTSRQVHVPDVVKTFRAQCYRRLKANYAEVCDCELKD